MLVKHTPKPDFDAFVWAMWLSFLRCPTNPNPDIDGMFDLGAIDAPRSVNQRLKRGTPYSICEGPR